MKKNGPKNQRDCQHTPILAIGVMTGNSVDGIDTVLTAFHQNGRIHDLQHHFVPFDNTFYLATRALQKCVAQCQGDMTIVEKQFFWSNESTTHNFDSLQNELIDRVVLAIDTLISKAQQLAQNNNLELGDEKSLPPIDIIGFHGQTCDHRPPSYIGSRDLFQVYSVQIGDGQKLADRTGITVAYDFRSDDLMAGGEAAPFAPMHNRHLVENVRERGRFPVIFCNAGNTGNLSLITTTDNTAGDSAIVTYGWDTGPFNHYPDLLMRKYRNTPYDADGHFGAQGHINIALLGSLFDHSVTCISGNNYLLTPPPKSGDPNFYRWLPMLDDPTIPIVDRVRTAEYFAAYAFFHSLSLAPSDVKLPSNFALFGGGWRNPIIRDHFEALAKGHPENQPILVPHSKAFSRIHARLQSSAQPIYVANSEDFGIDSQAMEARVFADMARCCLLNIPFSTPEITGVHTPTVGGILCFPHKNRAKVSEKVLFLLEKTAKKRLAQDMNSDSRWSRASAGWLIREDQGPKQNPTA